MKFTEIVEKYEISPSAFENYIIWKQVPHKKTFSGMVFDDSQVEELVADFREEQELLRIKNKSLTPEEVAVQKIEEARKRKALSEMLITSGFNFDGYRIVKYSGYISGDDAISVDRGIAVFGFGGAGARDELMKSLAKIRRNALRELKEAAYDLGCNAVIGVDFDYLTLDPQTHNIGGGTTLQPYVFGVTANGNAVIIEKVEEYSPKFARK